MTQDLSTDQLHDDAATRYEPEPDDRTTPEQPATDQVEVRRNAGVAALVGGLASAVAIAYLARAAGSGAALDWALCLVMAALAAFHLTALVDARVPLLVADAQGVRVRLGRVWRGLPWSALEEVEHQPRRGLRDGRLVLVVADPDAVLGDLDRAGRRQARVAQRLHGAPLAVPLALTTRVVGADGDLTAALARLADDPATVVELLPAEPEDVEVAPDASYAGVEDEPVSWTPEEAAEPVEATEPMEPTEPDPAPELFDQEQDDRSDDLHEDQDDHPEPEGSPLLPDPRPVLARGIGSIAARLHRRHHDDGAGVPDGAVARPAAAFEDRDASMAVPPVVASATPSPLRDPVTAVRAEIRSDLTFGANALRADPSEDETSTSTDAPGSRVLRRPGSVNLVEDTVLWGERVRPIAREGAAVEPLVIDDLAAEPAEDPVIGPELAAARTRLGLSVDQLADRTRIRPHVIESIEVDDFAPCGGDFYARGHLRTLARVLGVDVTPLLAEYDERYADAPISPRRVFEAELATGAHGSIRGTRGGPNWSVLVAAVMAVVLAWSIARLLTDSPVDLNPAIQLNGSHGPTGVAGAPVPVALTAAGGGAQVVVKDGSGKVVFEGSLAFGETKNLSRVEVPVRVQSSDGSVQVSVDGKDRGSLGADGRPAQNTFTVAD